MRRGEAKAAPWGTALWASSETVARPPLGGDIETDVAIVGAGLTGLWTAYYLQERDPGLSITLLEKETAGFGASGRNGGWCSSLFPQSAAALEKRHGRDAAEAMRRAMIATVDEVGRVAAAEGIDADFVRGGTLTFARSRVQLAAARAEVDAAARFGTDALEFRAGGRGPQGSLGAVYNAACARVHPGKLVRGLARVVERRGAAIAERTEVLSWQPGLVTTTRGTLRAGAVIVATEGYGATIAQTHRDVLPLYSLMIATEPLPDYFWDEVGIAHGQTFSDFRHLLVYGQRTADNRIAFGGRGARYHWGSRVSASSDTSVRVYAHLEAAIADLFPAAACARITHHWGGPLGLPRDWHASVRFDEATRIGSAGGYVGDGLSTTNLAGRTLADLVTGTGSDLTRLPWAGHRSPRWESEPLRFAGANATLLAMTAADAEERVTGRRSVVARVMAPLTGH